MSVTALKAFKDNYIWIIQQMSSFICIDPGDPNPVLEYAQEKNLELNTILVTHYHHDHVGGVRQLMQSFPAAALYEPSQDLQSIFLPSYQFDVLSTPGHTENHICYYEPNQGWLFCGDTLFSAGCGRVFSGTHEQLFKSLMILKGLPDSTLVYCAHEYTESNLRFALNVEPSNHIVKEKLTFLSQSPQFISLPSTIALEKQINPFFRLEEPTIQSFSGCYNPFDTFKALRDAKDVF